MTVKTDKIIVGLFFGKKDDMLLYHFYQFVPSEDFKFITKATLKHHIKGDKFKIHIYTNLSPLLDLNSFEEDIDSVRQRNVIFTPDDDFLYEWIDSIPRHLRGNKIKQILLSRLQECIEVLKRGENEEGKENDNKHQQPPSFPYPQVVFMQQPFNQTYQVATSSYPSIPPNVSPQLQPWFETQVQATEKKHTSPINIDKDSLGTLSRLKGNGIANMGRR